MLKSGKFRNPKQEAINALVVCNDCLHFLVRPFCISGVGVYCLFLLQGLSGTSAWRISKKIRLHAFFMSLPNLFYYLLSQIEAVWSKKQTHLWKNVKFTVADINKEKESMLNNMVGDKIVEKFGDGHSTEFTIEDDILTIRTTKKSFSAPLDDVVVTYTVNNTVPVYTLKNTKGESITFCRSTTYLNPDDANKIEGIIEQLPGYKGRNKADKAIYLIYVAIFVGGIIIYALL